MTERVRCPKCGNYIFYQPATDELRCGHCKWEPQEPEVLKAITLHQPWASLVIAKHKTIETRLHKKLQHLKGQRIAIHAGKKYDLDAWREVKIWARSDEAVQMSLPVNAYLCPMGAVLGTAQVFNTMWLEQHVCNSRGALINCHDQRRFGLFLSDVVQFEDPIPASGKQGAWNWECPVDA